MLMIEVPSILAIIWHLLSETQARYARPWLPGLRQPHRSRAPGGVITSASSKHWAARPMPDVPPAV